MTPAQQLEHNLRHSRTAYLHAVRSLPSYDEVDQNGVQQHGFSFTLESHIDSQLIELGWAFFARYEGCLECWLKDQKVKLSKGKSLLAWFEEQEVEIPIDYLEGLKSYRKIRNSLHHDDGRSFYKGMNSELHIFEHHMENFFELFCWIGTQVEAVKGR